MDELQKLQLLMGNEIEIAVKSFIIRADQGNQDLQLANIAAVEEMLRRMVRLVSTMDVQRQTLGDESISGQGIGWLEHYFREDFWKDVADDAEILATENPVLES